MPRKIGFVIDPIENLNPQKDSSILLMNAACSLGYTVFWSSAASVFAKTDTVFGIWTPYSKSSIQSQVMAFDDLDIIFLREEPPLDKDYIELTYLYELTKKCVLINPADALRNASEKLYTLHFKQDIPSQLVSRNTDLLHQFVLENQIAILKPIGLFGSQNVLRLSHEDPDLIKKIQEATKQEKELVVCQQFLPDVRKGDRRIFLVHGEVMGSFDSIPAEGDFRGNSHYGARFAPAKASTRELEIIQNIKPAIMEDRLYFVGLDFVQQCLTEVNVSCVGGIWNMNHVYDMRFELALLKALLDPFIG
ncbi:MAG: hypothetical protein Q8Q33_00170 [Chlamydiota bacterium]|nr:hypothetical protein [Chlamydiota bacterium]